MGISVNVNPKLVSELNALIDGKTYHTRDEIKEVLSKYISIPSDELLREIEEEEEL